MLFSFFPPSTKTNHYSPLKESCKIKFSKVQIENHILKKNQMIKICAFKEKEGRKQGKTPKLVANGRLQAWWPLVCSKVGGFWKESNV
jgi:hypothetical protein